jgi:hypothetical protein
VRSAAGHCASVRRREVANRCRRGSRCSGRSPTSSSSRR